MWTDVIAPQRKCLSSVLYCNNTNAEVRMLNVNVTFTVFAVPFRPGIGCKVFEVLSVTEANQCVF